MKFSAVLHVHGFKQKKLKKKPKRSPKQQLQPPVTIMITVLIIMILVHLRVNRDYIPKKKNPLQGLSRSKKRRKLARMQEEKDRKDYEEQIEQIGGTKKKSPHQRMIEAVQKAKFKRRETAVQKVGGRQLNHSNSGVNDNMAMNVAVRKAKKRYRSKDIEDDADSFARRYGKIKEKPQREENKKAFTNKSRKAFKSKSRYKRRK
mmetsp:Transcript_10890/g.15094  ORF Transcript_10890/g.15094 Transcript_10890/m.15094 type:complete len:204 (+) Transcript_10890:105-716(+)